MRVRLSESLVLSVVLLLVPIGLLLVSQGATFAELGGAFSPMFFPSVVLWCWILVAAIGVAVELIKGGAGAGIPAGRWVRIGLVAVAMALYVFAFTRLGFLISSILFAAATLIILDLKKPVLMVVYAVLMPLALFITFHYLLGLPLPTSPFTYRF